MRKFMFLHFIRETVNYERANYWGVQVSPYWTKCTLQSHFGSAEKLSKLKRPHPHPLLSNCTMPCLAFYTLVTRRVDLKKSRTGRLFRTSPAPLPSLSKFEQQLCDFVNSPSITLLPQRICMLLWRIWNRFFCSFMIWIKQYCIQMCNQA